MTTPYTKYTLQLNVEKDADVIEYLNAQANKNGAIRRALRSQAWNDQMMERAIGKEALQAALADSSDDLHPLHNK